MVTGAAQSSANPPEGVLEGEIVRALRDEAGAPALDPSHDPHLTDEAARRLYDKMLLCRAVDERAILLQRTGKIGYHASAIGEEAAIVGAAAALRGGDWIFPSYREIGAALFRGLPLGAYVAHLFGAASDTAKGRQTPDHYGARALRVVSASPPVGTQIVHAVGCAWAAKLRKEDAIALAFFGDGATSSADFHNGLNFAGVFRVPVVFLCRNNGWAVSTPASRQTASRTLAVKAIAYGIPGVRVDGSDLFAVVKVVTDAVARAAAGLGPTLVEAITQRADPLERTRKYLESRGLWSAERDKERRAGVEAELARAEADAAAAGPPPRDSLFDDVYAELPWHLREQRESLRCR
jgi:pyruvate dehydrogenase E1 component subunit alpha